MLDPTPEVIAEAVAATATFESFALDVRLTSAVAAMGFEDPTPIQLAAIPPLLEGRDIVGGARTGSGKTAAFGLPLLERVKDRPGKVRALVLAPTRELAMQVADHFRDYAVNMPTLRIATIYGGSSYQPQLDALRRGATVVVGTPGRVKDLFERGTLDLSAVEMFVLDEADEMLRMGFIEDVEALLAGTDGKRQVALFSATMPAAIRRVANAHLVKPLKIQVDDVEMAVDHIDQFWINVPARHKREALSRVLRGVPRETTLVFARTRAACAETADDLAKRGFAVDALHGDLNQAARERVLERLRARRLDVVICTDVASRGIDVDHITHVVNYDLPPDTEPYVHRIGRTGRAGRKGVAISFITPNERRRVRFLQRDLGVKIEEMGVPTDADIARVQRDQLRVRLEECLANENVGQARGWLEVLSEEHEMKLLDLAAAAVHLLAVHEGGSLGEMPQEGAPQWAQSEQERSAPRDHTDHDHVELFFPIGRRSGLRPGDLVGFLANELGIPGSRIGRISIDDRKSFVGLPREIAEDVVKNHPLGSIRGVEVRISLAQPQGPGEDRGRPGGGRPRGNSNFDRDDRDGKKAAFQKGKRHASRDDRRGGFKSGKRNRR